MFVYEPPFAQFFSVVHEDDHVVVLDKPSGLLTVPGKAPEHYDCLEYRVQQKWPEAKIVHRLDMDTSGLCIMAKTKEAHRNLSMQFQRRKTAKTYVAEVFGQMPSQKGQIDLPLICDWPNRPKQMVDHEKGKPSLTLWEVIEVGEKTSRVRLFPHTGRSHQLRVHLMSVKCPILGDRFYAPDDVVALSERLMLHAEELTVHHPSNGERVLFTAPCPF